MKKLSYCLSFVFIFMIGMFISIVPVSADTGDGKLTVWLDCPSNVKLESRNECLIRGDLENENLTEISLKLNVSDTSIVTLSRTDININGIHINPGKNLIISDSEDALLVLANKKVGDVKLTITEATAKDSNGDDIKVSAVEKSLRVQSNDSKLKDIKVDNKTINGYKESNLTYSFSVNSPSIELSATKKENAQTVSGTGKQSLICGNNQLNIISYAEDSTKTTYVLNVTRNCSSDSSLKGIKLSSGALTPAFSEEQLNYRVDVSKDIDKISIIAVKKEERQNVEGEVKNKALNFGDNTFKLTVFAEDGTRKEYEVIVNREDTRSNNAKLQVLSLSAGKLEFVEDVYEYNVRVPYETNNIKVTTQTVDNTSKVEVIGGNNLVVGENLITVKVTAENGEVLEYKVHVNRLKEGEPLGDNPDIYTMTVDGYALNFDKNVYRYVLEIGNEKELSFNIIMEDLNATYVIEGNENLEDKDMIRVITKALDGSSKTYEIVVEKANPLWIYVVAGLSIVAAIVLIIVIVVKSKKKNNGNTVKKDKDLINKVEQQLSPSDSISNEEVVIPTLDDAINEPVINTETLNESVSNEPVVELKEEPVVENTVMEENVNNVETGTNDINVNEVREVNQGIVEDNFLDNSQNINQNNLYNTKVVNNDALDNILFNKPLQNNGVNVDMNTSSNEQVNVNQEQGVKEVQQPKEATTKICNICGHRIPVELTECPYCRKKF